MFKFGSFGHAWGWSLLVLGGLLLAGCNSSESAANAGSGGQVTDEWRGYCVAQFTSDVAIKDGFGDIAFTAHSGEEYLLTEYESFGGEARVEIAYLAALGPDTYALPVTGGPETFPFTSNCAYGAAVQYYAAFTDVTVFDSEAMSKQICRLPAGTAVLRDMTRISGATAVGLSLSGPQTYDIMLNAFGPQCGGATHGYVSVPQTNVLGTTTWLIPITVVLGPQ